VFVTDVLGVVTTFNDVQHTVKRSTGQEFVKRDINIVDDSNVMVSNLLNEHISIFYYYERINNFLFICQVSVTLWGKQAEDFDGSNNPIIAIKGARIGEFNGGKNLSLLNSSVLEKDPDLPEAHKYIYEYKFKYYKMYFKIIYILKIALLAIISC